MQFEDNLTRISSILRKDGLALFAADGFYGIACNAYSSEALNKLRSVPIPSNYATHEILVSDLIMLKNHVSHLHPRIETLLHYHERPLKVNIDFPLKLAAELRNKELYFRITKDRFCSRLIHTLGNPIYFKTFLSDNQKLPLEFHSIDNLVFACADVVLDNNMKNGHLVEPILRVKFDDEGFLSFLE